MNFPFSLLRALLLLVAACTALKSSVWSAGAQEVRESLAGEKAAEEAKKREILEGYDLRWGPVSFQIDASLHTEFTDNAFYSAINPSSDVILRPEVKINSYWPITDINALTFSLGVGYEVPLQKHPDQPQHPPH